MNNEEMYISFKIKEFDFPSGKIVMKDDLDVEPIVLTVCSIDPQLINEPCDLNDELTMWQESTYYPNKKLLGGDDTEQTINLSPIVKNQLKLIVKSGYAVDEYSQALLKTLIAENIITPETTFNDIDKNNKLKMALSDGLKAGLETDIQNSRWGSKVVSDFDLAVNLKTDTNFNTHLKALKVLDKTPLYEELKRNRRNLFRFVNTILKTIIHLFELPETPDPTQKKRTYKKKPYKTPQELSDISSNTIKAIGNTTTINVSDSSSENLTADASLINAMNNSTIISQVHVSDPVPNGTSSNTGPTVNTGNTIVSNQAFKSIAKRSVNGKLKDQVYETPESALNILWNHYGRNFLNADGSNRDITIFDPCCGPNARIVKFFKNGLDFNKTIGSDIAFGNPLVDIFSLTSEDVTEVDYIITNTPFKPLEKYIEHLEKLNKPYITLIPVYAMSYKSIRNIFAKKQVSLIFIGHHKFYVNDGMEQKGAPMGQAWLLRGNFKPDESSHVHNFIISVHEPVKELQNGEYEVEWEEEEEECEEGSNKARKIGDESVEMDSDL